jgi:hypothetical protein
MGKKSRSRSRMNIPDHIFDSLETIVWVKNLDPEYFDPGSRIWDPGWKKLRSGMEKIWIRDKHSKSATLIVHKIFIFTSCHVLF